MQPMRSCHPAVTPQQHTVVMELLPTNTHAAILSQARFVLSVTAYNWLHPAGDLPPAVAAKKLAQMRRVLQAILRLGSARSPFARKKPAGSRKASALLLAAGRDKAVQAMSRLKSLKRQPIAATEVFLGETDSEPTPVSTPEPIGPDRPAY